MPNICLCCFLWKLSMFFHRFSTYLKCLHYTAVYFVQGLLLFIAVVASSFLLLMSSLSPNFDPSLITFRHASSYTFLSLFTIVFSVCSSFISRLCSVRISFAFLYNVDCFFLELSVMKSQSSAYIISLGILDSACSIHYIFISFTSIGSLCMCSNFLNALSE